MTILKNTTAAILFLLFALIIVGGVNWYAIESMDTLLNKEKRVSRIRDMMQKTEKVEKLTARINTGYTGFLLTDNEKFLVPFVKDIPALKEAVANLTQSSADNPLQQENIKQLKILLNSLSTYAENLVRTYRETGVKAAVKTLNSSKEQQLLKEIQRVFLKIEKEESHLLAQRTANVRRRAKIIFHVQILGMLIMIIFLLLAYWLMRRELIRRRRAQKEIKQAAKEMDRFFALLPGLSLIVGFKGNVHKLNPRWQQELGYTREDLDKMRFYDLVHPEDKKLAINAVKFLLRGKTITDLQIRMLTKQGKSHWWAWAAAADMNRKLIYTFAHNIDELKTIRESIDMLSERFQLATRIGKIGVWDWDLKTRELVVDEILKEIYGIKPGDKDMAQMWAGRIHPEDRCFMQDRIQECILNHEELSESFRIVHPVEGVKYLQTIGKVMFDENGTPYRMIGVSWDITEKKKNEIALQEAREKAEKASHIKSLFLANMSHEIRTPMNAILGFAEILSQRIKDPVQHEHLASMQSSGKALLNLINDLLDFSKAESGKLELFEQSTDVRYLVHDIESIFRLKAQQKHLDFVVEIDKNVPRDMLLDEIKIRQVLLNLTSNAIKFTEKGRVKISVRSDKIDDSRADLILEVSDTGKGIPPEYHEKIFQLFEQQDTGITRKYGGTGLGLAISMQIVQLMKGRIDLMSEEGKGSTFRVVLPAIPLTGKKAVRKELPGSDLEKLVFDPATILIVDDTPSNIVVLKAMLENQPFVLLEAQNGRDALEV
ncbi:MAG: PAS domain-containing protein, partial [Chlorobi bacterium]|nr:PAS domain-containing protein [Chlorobiota bacterium]